MPHLTSHLFLLLAATTPLCAQTSVPVAPQEPAAPIAGKPASAAPYDTRAALATAFQHLDDSEKDVNRFTYFQDITMGNVSRAGHVRDVTSFRYEATYINGLPYLRLLEKDGAPLTGDALKDEQKRYEKALSKKKKLDEEKRASSEGFTADKADFSLRDALTPSYSLTIRAAGLLKGVPTHVIDAEPVPGIKRKSHCTWHLRFWVNDSTGNFERYAANTGTDTSPECANESADTQYTEIGGVPKPTTEDWLLRERDEYGVFLSKSRVTYSNYRRFGATITIKTGDVIPPDDTSAPPPADAKP